MHWKESRTDGLMDGRRDGQCDYYTLPKVPMRTKKTVLIKKIELLVAVNPVCINSTSLNKA